MRQEERTTSEEVHKNTGTSDQAGKAWHGLGVEEVLGEFGSSQEGLSQSAADERLEAHGPNRIGGRRRVTVWQVLLHQFQSPLIYVLLGALVVTLLTSWITGESRYADAIVIGLVLIVNGTVGFLQEYRAESAVEALMQMVAPKARVVRGGEERLVPAETLVPGDIVLLDEGRVVPADLRLVESSSLQIDEAALTGESVPVSKTSAAMEEADEKLPPADRNNMAFMGTAVTSGHGQGVVVATGHASEIGQIAAQVEQATETETPLQRRIQRLAVRITWAILAVALVAFATGLLMGRDWAQMVTLAVALSVAAIPAGLPIVVTVALAIGVQRMARRHAVIRHLPAVDTLGSCTTIVSDKTGTLTQNRMSVKAIRAGSSRFDMAGEARSPAGGVEQSGESVDLGERAALYQTLLAGVLCNGAELAELEEEEESASKRVEERAGRGARRGDEGKDAEGQKIEAGENEDEHEDGEGDESRDEDSGDPMEIALLYAGLKAGLKRSQLLHDYPQTDEVPFRTQERFMATIHDVEEDGPRRGDAARGLEPGRGPLVVVKGAPERVAAMCNERRLHDGTTEELEREALVEESESLAAEGLRVLAMAVGRGDEAVEAVKGEEPSGMTFVGMQGLLDPPRRSAVEAVDACHEAGIRVIMVTGDHASTARAIAHEVHVDRPAHAGVSEEEARRRHEKRREGDDDEPPTPTGREIAELEDEELDRRLAASNVFARVEPIQKTRIVERLKENDEIVAVTGDGVNDAPALKNAHLGAAMGSGTDVAKEASDMVITDDNFASVYAAVELGRTAFRNIRMATFFLLSTGAADVLIILTSLAAGWPLPLLPAQILWCNVVTNGIADVALAFEPGEKALYRRPPRPPSEGVLDRVLIERLVLVGIWLAVGVLGVFVWRWGFDFATWSGDEDKLTLARTAALTTLVLFQKVHVFNCKSEDVSLFRKSLWSNKLLFLGVMASLAVHVGAIYIPLTQDLLSLAPLDATTWVVSTLVALTAIIVNEVHKRFRKRYVEASET